MRNATPAKTLFALSLALATTASAKMTPASDYGRVEDLDERVLTLGDIRGTGGGSGVQVQAEAAWLHTVTDGRCRKAIAPPGFEPGTSRL